MPAHPFKASPGLANAELPVVGGGWTLPDAACRTPGDSPRNLSQEPVVRPLDRILEQSLLVTKESPRIHPLVATAAELSTQDLRGRVDFSEKALVELRACLQAIEGDGEQLSLALTGLAAFAAYLHRDCGSEKGGLRLLELVAERAGSMRQRLASQTMTADLLEAQGTARALLGSLDVSGAAAGAARPAERPSASAGIKASTLLARRRIEGKGVRL